MSARVGTGLRTADVVVATREELGSAIFCRWRARGREVALPMGVPMRRALRRALARPQSWPQREGVGRGESSAKSMSRCTSSSRLAEGRWEEAGGEFGGRARAGMSRRDSPICDRLAIDESLCFGGLSKAVHSPGKSAEFTRTHRRRVPARPPPMPWERPAPRLNFARVPRVRREQAEDPCHRPTPLQ